MSKLVFSTLSVLALLFAGANCSTGIRGGGGGGGQIDGSKKAAGSSQVIPCTVGLVLKPGDRCSGPNYSLHNNAGTLEPQGPYTKSCRVFYHPEAKTKVGDYNGWYACDALVSGRNGNAWTIKSLPPPTETVR